MHLSTWVPEFNPWFLNVSHLTLYKDLWNSFYVLNSPPSHHIPNKTPVFVGEVQRTLWLSLSPRTLMFCWTCLTRIQLVMVSSPLMDFEKFQFSSVAQLCPTLCDPMNRSMPGLPVHHQLLESIQTHVHWVGETIQPSHQFMSQNIFRKLSELQKQTESTCTPFT